MPLKALDQMYKSIVRPHLDYCDFIYHIPHVYENCGVSLNAKMESVEKVQYNAALAITGTWKGSSRVKLYEELGWESLSDRRFSRRILQLHKIINNETPKYLREILPQNRHQFLLNIFRNIRCRTNRYKNSFFPDAIKSWNHIISNFNDLPSREMLRKHLLSFFRPTRKSIFGLHDPIGLRYLFQLRVGLSPLLSHKKKYNFLDTPTELCSCNLEAETTDHFFEFCILYRNQRNNLESKTKIILQRKDITHVLNPTNLYLYGHPELSYNENREILTLSIEYIKLTKRFIDL